MGHRTWGRSRICCQPETPLNVPWLARLVVVDLARARLASPNCHWSGCYQIQRLKMETAGDRGKDPKDA